MGTKILINSKVKGTVLEIPKLKDTNALISVPAQVHIHCLIWLVYRKEFLWRHVSAVVESLFMFFNPYGIIQHTAKFLQYNLSLHVCKLIALIAVSTHSGKNNTFLPYLWLKACFCCWTRRKGCFCFVLFFDFMVINTCWLFPGSEKKAF